MFTTTASTLSTGIWEPSSTSSEQRSVLDETLVVVASDHGEHLGDHSLFLHGCSLYRQLVGVPLVIVDPKVVPAGRTVAEPVSLRDIPATIVDLVGLAERTIPWPITRSVLGRDGSAARPAIASRY